jgi:tetraacyldisaccharide 4'-kinase
VHSSRSGLAWREQDPTPFWAPRPSRLRRPVISIGNIALGGRGKTPLVALVARILMAHGERPAILSRGYRRRRHEEGVVVVSDGMAILADVDRSGDEPLMLAECLPGAPVLVSDLRTTAGALAERVFGATVHVLDDGFQHRALARDVDVVVVAPEDLAGRRLPFGRLREIPRALSRADAVIVDAPSGDSRPLEFPRSADTRLFRMRRVIGSPDVVGGVFVTLNRSLPVVAVAGIARPERFRVALEADGWRVGRMMTFRDHHRFTTADTGSMVRAARDIGAEAIFTTAKDAVRLRPLGPLPVPLAVVRLDVVVEPTEGFQTWLLDRVRAARESRA